jgi:hypothetical protein
MAQVDFISDRLTTKIIADNVAELKRLASAKLDEDIDWSKYIIKVDNVERPDTYVFEGEHVEVRAVQSKNEGGL